MTATTMRRKKARSSLGAILVNGSLALLIFIWLLPVVGLLISSFRSRFDIQTSGWWTILPHQEWVTASQMDPPTDQNRDGVMTIEGAQGTFEQFRAGISAPNGERVIWLGNKRLGTIQVQKQEWRMGITPILDNYDQVLGGKNYEIRQPDGKIIVEPGVDFSNAFINSIIVTVPATLIPILIAAFAAYGFAWMQFPGRRTFFTIVVALLVVPLQIALVPILRDYVGLNLNGTFLGIWLAHTGFGLPLATYLLFGYISSLPRDILESAFIDGASHFTIFLNLILPLSMPALASFAIFQFLWVWNDYLVALIFIGSRPDVQVLTMRVAEMVGSRGNDWHLLTAGSFVSMILPLTVFFSLQRYFVRGLLSGSVKG